MEYANNADNTTFKSLRKNITVSGWPGPNIINFSRIAYGGFHETAVRYFRFTFRVTAVSENYKTKTPLIYELGLYGDEMYSYPSNYMSRHGHLYNWDVDQNATFPALVSSSNTPTEGKNLTNKTYVDSAVARQKLTDCFSGTTYQFQKTSYQRSVIALCKVSTTANTTLDSYTSGYIYFHRINRKSANALDSLYCSKSVCKR